MDILILIFIGITLCILHYVEVKTAYSNGYLDGVNDMKKARNKEIDDILKKLEDE